MKAQQVPYKPFSNYILRTPLFPIDFFMSLNKNLTTSEESIKEVCGDDRIKEAIFLASPDLFFEMKKWFDGKLNEEKSRRVKYSILKYLSRLSSRCTPFGLFAGTSVGKFSDNLDIELDDNIENKRHTRLDMNYLVALTQTLTGIGSIKQQLKFYPNTSLYEIGNQFRYVEYSYVDTKRVHHIVAVSKTWYLDELISAAKHGLTIQQLTSVIVSEEIELEDAKAFINQLIESQILISELEPSVSGSELMDHIIDTLSKLTGTQEIIEILKRVQQKLKHIDQSITNNVDNYIQIGEELKPLQTKFDLKYLFQTDMVLSQKQNTLDHSILRKIRTVFSLLNKISIPQENSTMSQFIGAFYERYETKSVPLSIALDKELGIGFLQDKDYGDLNPLIDDLNIPPNSSKSKTYQIRTNLVEDILHKKLIDCIAEHKTIIQLNDDDFKDLEENWNDLPDTMSSMIEILTVNDEQKIALSFIGGSSATNLLGRFCHSDVNINELVKEIIEVEDNINKDKIVAEIVHLPESRVGNILFRPHLRHYEIPYLANSTKGQSNTIGIEDLEIQTPFPNQILIKSKTHNKEVVPRLSNAHNFSVGALPVYQFLASAQNSVGRKSISFSWGTLETKFDFLPRVEYKGIILSYKLWNIKKDCIKPLTSVLNDPLKLQAAISEFRISKQLPKLTMLKDGDNELLINLDNLTSVKMFFKYSQE